MSRGLSVNSMGRCDLIVEDVREEPRVPQLRVSTCWMYRCRWSLHLIIICLLEYVQEVSTQGETQWKAVSKAFLGRFSGLIENHHSCIPALKVTGFAVLWYIVSCASSWTRFPNLINLQTTPLLPPHNLPPCKCSVHLELTSSAWFICVFCVVFRCLTACPAHGQKCSIYGLILHCPSV